MIYTTRDGISLKVGRISRQSIDRFIAGHPVPEVPTRQVEAFGGVIEELPMLDDPTYLAELGGYYAQLGYDQVGLIAEAVTVLGDEAQDDLDDMLRLGLVMDDSEETMLRHALAEEEEMAAVVAAVFYESTVTERGVLEAAEMFGAMWRDRSVLAWHLPRTAGRYNQVYEDRTAARFSGYGWEQFCELPGPEQSACVAFYRVTKRLEWLQTTTRR